MKITGIKLDYGMSPFRKSEIFEYYIYNNKLKEYITFSDYNQACIISRKMMSKEYGY